MKMKIHRGTADRVAANLTLSEWPGIVKLLPCKLSLTSLEVCCCSFAAPVSFGPNLALFRTFYTSLPIDKLSSVTIKTKLLHLFMNWTTSSYISYSKHIRCTLC